MRVDPEGSYFMPVSTGPSRPLKAGVFRDVWTAATSYRSDKDALAALLPEPFEPADEPLVTIYYMKCRQINFLAGGGYNAMGVNLATYFNGQQDQLQGDFAVVLWEDLTAPILRGRELLGCPKVYGEIPDPYRIDNEVRVQTSDQGHMLLEMRVENVQPMDPPAIGRMEAEQKERNWMGWKYIPNVDGVGAAVSQPTLIGIEKRFTEAWSGQGTICFGNVSRETNPESVDIIATLQKLKVTEYVGSTLTQGSFTITRTLNRVLQ